MNECRKKSEMLTFFFNRGHKYINYEGLSPI